LESKAHNKGYFSSETRKVNFVIYVVNGLLVLKAMKNAGALETQYVETIVSTFNCPFLSFKGICIAQPDINVIHFYIDETAH